MGSARDRRGCGWIVAGVALAALVPLARPAAASAQDGEAASRVRWFPDTTAFAPLLAHPRETWLRGSFVLADRPDLERFEACARVCPGDFEGRNIEAEVALGLRLPVVLLRPETRGGPSVTIEVEAGAFSRFYMEAPEKDLINADYRVGAPVSLGYRGWEARVELRHLSSHFGDDFVRRFDPPFQQVSEEGFEVAFARRLPGGFRVYAGGDWNFGITPGLSRTVARWGLEADPGARRPDGTVWPFAAADFAVASATDRVAGTGVAGLAFRVRGIGLRLEARGHFGPSPMGQLRAHDETFWGLGLRIEPRRWF